jgi:hypothetical protein
MVVDDAAVLLEDLDRNRADRRRRRDRERGSMFWTIFEAAPRMGTIFPSTIGVCGCATVGCGCEGRAAGGGATGSAPAASGGSGAGP